MSLLHNLALLAPFYFKQCFTLNAVPLAHLEHYSLLIPGHNFLKQSFTYFYLATVQLST